MFGPQSISGPGNAFAIATSSGGNFQSNLSDDLSGKYCVNLDGTDDSLRMWGTASFPDQMGAGESWTFSFQINFGASAASQTIMFKGSTTTHVWLQTDSGGDLTFASKDSNVAMFSETWNTNFTNNTWYNVVIVMDGSSSEYVSQCYVDGSEIASTAAGTYSASNSLNHGGTKLAFGVLLNVIYFPMILDEFNFWTVALDATNVAAIFANDAGVLSDKGNYDRSSDLWGSYRFEEGIGTTAADTSGNSRVDITLYNTTWVTTVRTL